MGTKKTLKKDESILIQSWGTYEFKLFPGTKSTKPYVHFQFINPDTNDEERIRKMAGLKPTASLPELKKQAKLSIEALIELLQGGWNPKSNVFNDSPVTPLSPIIECIDYWLKERAKAVEVKAIGESTLKGNTHLMMYFKDWLKKNQFLYRKPKTFTKIDVDNFLSYTAHHRGWGKVSYNTYRTDLGTFFSHLVTLKIVPENPVKYSEKKNVKNDSSRFVIYEEEELKKVVNLLANDNRFLDLYIAAKLVFTYNLRPVEITRIQIEDVKYDKTLLILPPGKTKNHNEAKFQLSDTIFNLIDDMAATYPTNYFLFGGWNKPNVKQVGKDFFGARWRLFREANNIPYHLKFYALKHSNDWYDLEDGVSIQTISERNRHASPNVTIAYVKQRLNKKIIQPSMNARF